MLLIDALLIAGSVVAPFIKPSFFLPLSLQVLGLLFTTSTNTWYWPVS
jgi:hypothetical protein